MKASELRIGNLFYPINRSNYIHIPENIPFKIYKIEPFKVTAYRTNDNFLMDETYEFDIQDISPIPLSEKLLLMTGFEIIENLITGRQYQISIDRDRYISISGLGTCNEFVFLSDERDQNINDVIVLKNFDYDGKTYFHQLQNLYSILTGKELVNI